MLDWLIENREWMFSGVGVAIATAIISGLLWLTRRRQQNSSAPTDFLKIPKVIIRRDILLHDADKQRAQRNRHVLLERVKSFWIGGVLDQSLHGAAMIELGLEKHLGDDEYLWDTVLQASQRPNFFSFHCTKIVDVFDEMQGSLLLLGEPGSGKTTMLLELARDMIVRAEQNPDLPIPVVFNLSSWAEQRHSIEKWLIDELREKYKITKKVAQSWIENDELLLLLDGLDEVKHEYRNDCVKSINQFQEERTTLGQLVICSRIAVYETLETPVEYLGAVVIQPLTPKQISEYLEELDRPDLLQLADAIQNDMSLQELFETPLMLNIVTLAYQDESASNLRELGSTDILRQYLFDTYVHSMFNRTARTRSELYSKEQTIGWLSWLAKQMTQHSQTEFLIERMQPSWLSTNRQQHLYAVSTILIGGVAFFLVSVLSYFIAIGIYAVIDGTALGISDVRLALGVGAVSGTAFVLSSILAVKFWLVPFISLMIGGGIALTGLFDPWTVALVVGIIFGLPSGLAGRLLVKSRTIQIIQTYGWSWRKAVRGLIVGLAAGFIGAGLVSEDKLTNGMEIGLPIGLIAILISGFVRTENIQTRIAPSQGLMQSIRSSINIGFVVVLAILLSGSMVGALQGNLIGGFEFGVLIAGVYGLAASFYFGGSGSLQHIVLRFILYRNGYIPWNLVKFLDYSVDRIFLYRVGSGYRFVHQWLMEYYRK